MFFASLVDEHVPDGDPWDLLASPVSSEVAVAATVCQADGVSRRFLSALLVICLHTAILCPDVRAWGPPRLARDEEEPRKGGLLSPRGLGPTVMVP